MLFSLLSSVLFSETKSAPKVHTGNTSLGSPARRMEAAGNDGVPEYLGLPPWPLSWCVSYELVTLAESHDLPSPHALPTPPPLLNRRPAGACGQLPLVRLLILAISTHRLPGAAAAEPGVRRQAEGAGEETHHCEGGATFAGAFLAAAVVTLRRTTDRLLVRDCMVAEYAKAKADFVVLQIVVLHSDRPLSTWLRPRLLSPLPFSACCKRSTLPPLTPRT